MPAFMRGVINLRGSVIPVVDLRLKLGMGMTTHSVQTSIVVVEVNVEGERTVLGAMADTVREVFELGAPDIEPAPRIGSQLDTSFLKGVGKRKDDFVLLLDIDRVFSGEELGAYMKAREQASPRAE